MLLASLICSGALSTDPLQSPTIVDVSFASLTCYQLSDFDYARSFLLSYLMHLSNRPLLSPMQVSLMHARSKCACLNAAQCLTTATHFGFP
ncbi:hypothetical protein BDW60DRAFT_172713 [Aspergillus nidulans var. acristatus]